MKTLHRELFNKKKDMAKFNVRQRGGMFARRTLGARPRSVTEKLPAPGPVARKVPSTASQERALYNSLTQEFGPNAVITESYLRSEVDVTGGINTIRFPILVNDQPQANVLERRLNINDAFQVTAMGLFIYKTPSGENRYEQRLQTYSNASLFSGTGEARNFQVLYNAFFSITINRKQLIPYMDAFTFQRVPDTQQGMPTIWNGSAALGPSYSSYLKAEWGFRDVLPTYRCSGSYTNEIVLNLPATATLTGTSSANTVVLFLRGYLMQNAAQFNPSR